MVFAEGDAEVAANRLTLLHCEEKRRALGKQGGEAVRQGYTVAVVARHLHDVLASSI